MTMADPARETEIELVTQTTAHKKAQRARSIAIALSLASLVVIFYLVTLAKFGPAILDRAL